MQLESEPEMDQITMKKLIIIDPNISLTSPSMRGIALSLPLLKSRGWQIEVWCWWCDENLPVDHIVKVPMFGNIHTFSLYAFAWYARWLRRTRGTDADVVLTLAPYVWKNDVVLVQFSPFDWARRQRVLGMHSVRDIYERVSNYLALHFLRRFLRRTTARLVLSVSQAVAGDLRAENPALNIQLLPNCYDPKRFHPGVRDQFRAETRQKLGIAESDHVFVFASAGHYRRKGFFLAFEALKRLRGTFPNVRFLVVGGRPERLTELQAQIGGKHDWVTFTGMVPDVERYLAAADGFLFPSYSEAFALVEVEAAACGLPLFLTPHHGSEMILEDGVNGRRVEFDVAHIASVLTEFIDGRWRPQPSVMKFAIDSAAYGSRLEEFLRTLCPAS